MSESEAEQGFPLWLRHLWSNENCIVEVGSRSGRINESQCLIRSWFFRFCFRLRQSSFHWIISDGVISGVGRKWKRSDSSASNSVELMTPLTTPIFDFHQVISALTTTTPTPTPSLVKTSLKSALSHVWNRLKNCLVRLSLPTLTQKSRFCDLAVHTCHFH